MTSPKTTTSGEGRDLMLTRIVDAPVIYQNRRNDDREHAAIETKYL